MFLADSKSLSSLWSDAMPLFISSTSTEKCSVNTALSLSIMCPTTLQNRSSLSLKKKYKAPVVTPANIVDQMDAHNAFICEAMCRAYGTPMVDRNVVHWMSHSQIDMFIFMVTHIDNEKDALKFVETGMKYLISGWYGLVKPWQDPE